MKKKTPTNQTTIKLEYAAEQAQLELMCGHCQDHLKKIEQALNISIKQRNQAFQLVGDGTATQAAKRILDDLYALSQEQESIDPKELHLLLCKHVLPLPPKQERKEPKQDEKNNKEHHGLSKVSTLLIDIQAQSDNQNQYLRAMDQFDLTFGIGPSGSGKTYLAVAAAVKALEQNAVKRILLARPAVEAGEKLGFLPGDLSQKVDPYLCPLYDALYDMLGNEKTNRYIEAKRIEIAPLAYMRGRTINESFIIVDEAQNTTKEQMKMCLTRIGFGSKAVITGDITQIDLAPHQYSGLKHAMEVLQQVDDIAFCFMKAEDIVRHALVQKIIHAYDKHALFDNR